MKESQETGLKTTQPKSSLFSSTSISLRLYWPEIVSIAIIMTVALFLRLINLDGWPRWYTDEGIYSVSGTNLYHGIIGVKGYEPNPGAPLFPIISGFFTLILGNSMVMSRVISAVSGALACVVVFLVARKLYGLTAGIISGLFLAVSYNAVYFDRMAFNPALFDLTVALVLLTYLCASKTGKSKWVILLGLAIGASVLTKLPQGGFAIFLVFIMAALDKKIKAILAKSMAVATAFAGSIYVGLGFVNDTRVYWQSLIGYGQGPALQPMDFFSLLRSVIIGQPVDQLSSQEGMYHFGLWATLGFIAIVYVAARGRRKDALVAIAGFSMFLTIIIPTLAHWYILLIGFIPIFAIATGRLLADFIHNKKLRLLILPVILVLGLSEWDFNHPVTTLVNSTSVSTIIRISPESIMIYFSLFVLLLGIAAFRTNLSTISLKDLKIRIPVKSIAKVISVVFIIAIIGMNIPTTLSSIVRNDSADQQAVVNWINNHTKPGDIVSVSLSLLYSIKPGVVAVEQEYLFHYQYNITGLRIWPSRHLTLDTPLQDVKYIEFDKSFTEASFIFVPLTMQIESTWKLVYQVGDCSVYQNPSNVKTTEIMPIADSNMNVNVRVADGGPNATIRVVNSSVVNGTPSGIDKIAQCTYDTSIDGPTRFRFLLDKPFNLNQVAGNDTVLQLWLYGDGTYYPVEATWRDQNGRWMRVQDISNGQFSSLAFKGWQEFTIPLLTNTTRQDGFDPTHIAGVEINVVNPITNPPIASTIYIGNITIEKVVQGQS